MAYSGKFIPDNKEKYKGDIDKIQYRSLWERKVMVWLDHNPDVVWWQSEETVIPYVCRTDGEWHRYFTDFVVQFKNGKTVMIEVKPESQTVPPKATKNRKRYITEATTYAKNISKWEAAREYCKKRNWVFLIWSEKTLENIGIKTKLYSGKR